MARIIPDWVRKANHNKDVGLKHGFRSGLEEKIGKQIEGVGQPVLFETFKLPYFIPLKMHSYMPDFVLANGIIIEGKGIFDSSDRAKHLLIKMQYPELDIRFVFSRLKAPIGPGAKSNMQDWCDKGGFKCAEKLIPQAWFSEPGPPRNPHDVIKDGPHGYQKAPAKR